MLRIETSSRGTEGFAKSSSSWKSSFAPYRSATVCGTGMESTCTAPYVASPDFAGHGIQRSVSPRRNFASADWMPVCGCATNESPVLAERCPRKSATKPVGFPSRPAMRNGHGEKSTYTGVLSLTRLLSHSASFSVSAAISLRLP